MLYVFLTTYWDVHPSALWHLIEWSLQAMSEAKPKPSEHEEARKEARQLRCDFFQ